MTIEGYDLLIFDNSCALIHLVVVVLKIRMRRRIFHHGARELIRPVPFGLPHPVTRS